MSKCETPSVEVWRIERDGGTGSFVGFATLITPRIAVLHPGAARLVMRLLPAAEPTTRLRCSVADGNRVQVIDGSVVESVESFVGRPLAIALDFSTGIDVNADDFPYPSQRLLPEEAGAIKHYLDRQAQQDPLEPTRTPPGPPDPRPPEDEDDEFDTRRTPPWCRLWPNCPGC